MSHLTSKFKSTPTATFKSRNQTITSSNRDEKKPSPFHYDANPMDIGKQAHPLGKFGKSIRDKQIKKISKAGLPGPGAYQSSSSINLGSFHKGETLKRGQMRFYEKQRLTPGPSDYKSIDKETKSVPKYSFFKEKRLREEARSLSLLPSPDAYNPKPQEHNATFTIGHSKRKENILPTRAPGPGAYIQQREFVSNKSFNQKSQIFPRARRMNSAAQLTCLPAPNSYNSQSFIQQNTKKQRGFTLQKRYSCKLIQTPSPHHYHNQSLAQKYAVKVGFPKAQRSFLIPQLRRSGSLPGPGSHDLEGLDSIKFKSSTASKFPKSKLEHLLSNRPAQQMDFINPERLDFTKRSIPKYTIPSAKIKPDAKLIVDKFYETNVESKNKQGSFKIPREKRMPSSKPSNVGPGYYTTEVTTVTTRKIKFSKEKRRTFLDDAIQGKLKLFRDQSYENREEFPNPPRYMNVHKKLAINDGAIKKY